MNKTYAASATLLALSAVVLGALGAHALEGSLSAQALDSYKTAVRYQMWHALALLFLSLCGNTLPGLKLIFRFWLTGIILFSGSIYLLSTQALWGDAPGWLGPLTPLGGGALIAGWAVLFVGLVLK